MGQLDMSFKDCMREKKSPYTPNDIARLIKVDKSTVSRFWNNPAWIEHVKGSTLVSLTNIIPGLQECVEERFFHSQAKQYMENFQHNGIELLESGLYELFMKYDNGVFIEIMEILDAIINVNRRKLQKLLVSAWNFSINSALSLLFANKKIIENTDVFYERCFNFLLNMNFESNVLVQVLPQTIIAHHLMRVNNDLTAVEIVGGQHMSSFVSRSFTMASIIGDNDPCALEKYQKDLAKSSILQRMEQWSYPSYYGDIKTKSTFSIPQKIILEKTYTKLFTDLLTRGEVYKNYLWTIQLPSLINIDPFVKKNRVRLESAIIGVLDRESDRKIADAGMKCLKLIRN